MKLTKNETQSSGKTCRQKTIPATMIIELALPLQKDVMFVQTQEKAHTTLFNLSYNGCITFSVL